MILLQKELVLITKQAIAAAQAAGTLPEFDIPTTIPLNRPKKAEWGDFSTAAAMQLAKVARRKPLDIANAIAQHLPNSPLLGSHTVTPPGFINYTFDNKWLATQVDAILQTGPAYFDLTLGQGQKAQVEFVSANPTGPLSIGRGRGGVLGDTYANMLEACGYEVTREYYFNNAGKQMDILANSLRVRYLQALGQDEALPDDHYQGEYLADLGKDVAAEVGDSMLESAVGDFLPYAEAAMFKSIKATLARMNIHHDVFFNENSLFESNAVWETLATLDEKGFVYEKDGARWFDVSSFGHEKDPVLVRSNGVPTYRLPDIAYHANKLNRGFDLVVNALGADHKDEFPDVKLGVRALGMDDGKLDVLFNQFVTVKGEKMSTRRGRFTTLDELMDEVGADVVRYFMLMRDANSHLDFDLDLALEQSDKNPVFYVQYAHARLSSVQRKAAEIGLTREGGDIRLLVHESELGLVRKLLELSELLEMAVRDKAPHHLVWYARDLAAAFHTCYRDCRVADADNPDLSRARLKLMEAARIGLAKVLGLMGVGAPTEM